MPHLILFTAFLLLWIYPSAQTFHPETLGKAATHHRVEEVKKILAKGAKSPDTFNIDAESGYFSASPLFLAVSNAYGPDDDDAITVIRLLLDAGADIRYADKYGSTILHLATEARMVWLMKECLRSGVDVNAKSLIHGTPLQAAMIYADESVIQVLLRAGANVNIIDKDGTHILHQAARRGAHGLMDICLEAGIPADLPDATGWTPLTWYVATGHYDLSWLIKLDKGKQPYPLLVDKAVASGNFGWLLYATGKNHPLRDEVSTPAICLAAEQDPALLQKMLDADFDITQTDLSGNTALHHAAMYGQERNVNALLAAGANPNHQNDEGKTPLHHFPLPFTLEGVIKSRAYTPPPPNPMPTLHALVEAGADLSVKDNAGKTPRDYAIEHLEAAARNTNGRNHTLRYAAEMRAFFGIEE